MPMNTEYHSEVGLRILLGFVVRATARYDRGIEPVFCYAREHFFRLHTRLLRGTNAADDSLARPRVCPPVPEMPGTREEERAMFPSTLTCPHLRGEGSSPSGPSGSAVSITGISCRDDSEARRHGAPGPQKRLQNCWTPAAGNCPLRAITITMCWQNGWAARPRIS